jgi:hypothetical protein
MALTPNEAKALCTEAEWRLVLESGPELIGTFSLAKIKTKVSTARKLSDKWNDLSIKQKRDAKLRDAAARSKQKAQLFRQTLASFVKQEKKLEREATAELNRKRKELLKKTKSLPRTGMNAALAKKAGKSPGVKKKAENLKKIQGHISSRNKRDQGKRDSK